MVKHPAVVDHTNLTESSQEPIRPLRLGNTVQNYEWGTRGPQAYIPRFLDIDVDENVPYAELWVGAHPKSPSTVFMNGDIKPLHQIIAANPDDMVGKMSLDQFGPKLPFLLKILSAGETLSIQAHPNKSQAENLHRNDPEHYPDDNHKPEIAIALDSLRALVGFKSWPELLETFSQLTALTNFIGSSQVEQLKNTNQDDDENKKATLKETFRLLIQKAENTSTLQQVLDLIDQQLQTRKRNKNEELFLEMRQKHKGPDVGLLSLLLYNIIELDEGQAVYLDAGIPHAYLKGNIIECMANSDNVVRAGLTPKFVDTETLVDILTYETGTPEIIHPDRNALSFNYPVPAPDFSITRHHLNRKEEVTCLTHGNPHLLLCLDGEGQLDQGEFSSIFQKSSSFFIPAAIKSFQLSSNTGTTVFQVSI